MDKFWISFYSGGILITSPGNIVGGHFAEDRNLISGNGYTEYPNPALNDKVPTLGSYAGDLAIVGENAVNNYILGNYIGTDVNGNSLTASSGPVDPRFRWGSMMAVIGASYVQIGDGSPAGRNVTAGIVRVFESSNVNVRGNYIGVNASGTKVLETVSDVNDDGDGVFIRDSTIVSLEDNRIGSSYYFFGVFAEDSDKLTISGNEIGLLPSIRRRLTSIYLLDVDDATIGGSRPNIIALPHPNPGWSPNGHAVRIRDSSSVRFDNNRLVPNPIANANRPWLALDLRGDGLDHIDRLDLDGKQNYPHLTEAIREGSNLRISGRLVVPLTQASFRIRLYGVSSPLYLGHGGEHMTYLGSGTLETTVSDVGTGQFDILVPFSGGDGYPMVTALVERTDLGLISEFAKNIYLTSAPADADTDGIPDEQERQLGDRNGDGTPDAEQDHVASFPAANGEPTTVAVSPAAAARPASPGGPRPLSAGQPHLEKVMAETVGTLDAPRGYSYPHGLMTFEVADIAAGATVNLRLILTAGATVDTLWSLAADGAWRALPNVTLGAGVLTVALTDGGAGDRDGVANGRIVAALGPAAALPPEPPLELALAPLASGNGVLLSWPAAARPAALEFSPDLSGDSWLTVPSQFGPRLNNDRWEFSWPVLPETPPATAPRTGFFRLRAW